MGIWYIDNLDRQLITASNLLQKFQELMSLGYKGNIKNLHLVTERCAYEL